MCDRSHLSQPRQHLLWVLNVLSAEEVIHKHRIFDALVQRCGRKGRSDAQKLILALAHRVRRVLTASPTNTVS